MSTPEEILDCLGNPSFSRCPQSSNPQLAPTENNGLNVYSYNFEFRSYRHEMYFLPGQLAINSHCIKQCVDARDNVRRVASFIRDVLQHELPNGTTAQYTSSINCVENPGQTEWRNAAWLDKQKQAIFGQCIINEQLRSFATSPDLVAHEFFHGLSYQIVEFEYCGQSGALDESYADIFGVLVANFENSDIATWNWEIGSGFGEDGRAIRNLRVPGCYGQPEHMDDYRSFPDDDDCGGVHYNSGIHNKAAYYLLSSQDAQGNYLFDASSGSKLFYLALRQLSEQSVFSDSRRAIQQVARTLFRRDLAKVEKLNAIATAFDNVGIGDNLGIFE
ncbi:hypothetical protein NUACC21_72170 [Scytonema sp. NUACC21]